MIASAFLAISTNLLLIAMFSAAFAAEIGCHKLYYGLSDRPMPEERAQRLWPSGLRPTASSCGIGYLKGPISGGDFEKLRRFYRSQHPFMHTFLVQSPGGKVDEAIKIGHLLRRYLIEAEAPNTINGRSVLLGYTSDAFCEGADCICASACALVWFGAPIRSEQVGLHRPKRTDASFGALSPDDASAQYRKALDAISSYMIRMGASQSIVEAMTATTSVDIAWIDDGRAGGEASIARDAGFDEWLRANCKGLGQSDYKVLLALQIAKGTRRLGPREQSTLSELSSLRSQAASCENEVVSVNRDKMSPP